MSTSSSPRSVLIADARSDERRRVRGLVEDLGLDASEVQDGAVALEHLQRECPALLVAQLEMPGVDGITLCEFVRSSPDLKDLPVILTVERDDPEVQERARTAGAADVAGRLIDDVVFATKIRRCVEGVDEWGGKRPADAPRSSAIAREDDPFSARIQHFLSGNSSTGAADEVPPSPEASEDPEDPTGVLPLVQDLAPAAEGLPLERYLQATAFGLAVLDTAQRLVFANAQAREWLNLLPDQDLSEVDEVVAEDLVAEIRVGADMGPMIFLQPFEGKRRTTLGLAGRVRAEEVLDAAGQPLGTVILIWSPKLET